MGAPPPPFPSESRPPIPRSFQFVLFCAAAAWYFAAQEVAVRAARGLSARFDLGSAQALLAAVFTLFLVVLGFRLLDWIATRNGSLASVAPLPRRSGCGTEWGIGAALGWGIALAAVLPLVISGNLHAHLLLAIPVLREIATSLAVLAILTLVEEIAFRGYLFCRLSQALGDTWAALSLSLLFGVVLVEQAPLGGSLTALIACTVFGILLSVAYLRTHALWLGWGVHFAYRAVVGVAIGLPIVGHGEFSSAIDSYTTGPRWLNGDAFGPDGAVLTIPALLAGIIILYRVTREYAWNYTHRPIVAAGYEVTVAPPAAHVAMEQKAAAAAPALVQIMPTTSQARSLVEPPAE
jgi:membrane protease YdiL (CAAX protease family)